MKEPMRVALVAGAGNVWGVYRELANGRPDKTTSHVAYSELFLRACRSVGAEALVLTTNPTEERFAFDGVELRRIPDHFAGKSGLAFHAANFSMAQDLRKIFLEWRPNVVLVPDDPARAIAIEWMRVHGAAFLRAHHCTLWPSLLPPGPVRRGLVALDRPILRHRFHAILSASSVVSEQIERVAGPGGAPILEFLPLYRREIYAQVTPADPHAPVLRVAFVGRIEENKGVFDLLQAAVRLRDRADLAFDICGEGSALPELRRRVEEAGLGDRFVLHGWCDRQKLVQVLSQAHIGCVPTRSSFIEGFNQACLELLLAGRPVVTSRAIPAIDYVKAAVREVRHDDAESYARAFAELADNRAAYDALRQACARETEKFFNQETSYGAALEGALRTIAAGQSIRPRRVGFDGAVHER